jgi:hypothetical protein
MQASLFCMASDRSLVLLFLPAAATAAAACYWCCLMLLLAAAVQNGRWVPPSKAEAEDMMKHHANMGTDEGV